MREGNLTAIAIHGCGRIGCPTFRAALANDHFVPPSITGIAAPPVLAGLFAMNTNRERSPLTAAGLSAY
ncbi:MAG TPA: hypothetical protein VIL85_07050 [Thermomicrobiales bacterium]|jgi:glyceraldehyde-3-phosphate dehydrogenase/erythrose-4-phosphate dehydrogenase